MKAKGKKKKRSGRDRWDGVLNRNCPPPPQISDLYQGRRPVFEEISTAIRCKWVEAKNERLFDQLRDDPISWQRAVRCKRGWNGSGCVFSLCPRLKHQSSTDNNSPLKRISPSSKDNQLSHLIFTVEPLLFTEILDSSLLSPLSLSFLVSFCFEKHGTVLRRNDDWF